MIQLLERVFLARSRKAPLAVALFSLLSRDLPAQGIFCVRVCVFWFCACIVFSPVGAKLHMHDEQPTAWVWTVLSHHFHPTVKQFSHNVLKGRLPGRLTPQQVGPILAVLPCLWAFAVSGWFRRL